MDTVSKTACSFKNTRWLPQSRNAVIITIIIKLMCDQFLKTITDARLWCFVITAKLSAFWENILNEVSNNCFDSSQDWILLNMLLTLSKVSIHLMHLLTSDRYSYHENKTVFFCMDKFSNGWFSSYKTEHYYSNKVSIC